MHRHTIQFLCNQHVYLELLQVRPISKSKLFTWRQYMEKLLNVENACNNESLFCFILRQGHVNAGTTSHGICLSCLGGKKIKE